MEPNEKLLTLMNKNTPVCDIKYNTRGHYCSEIIKVWNKNYASPALLKDNEITEDTFNNWWMRRAIPITRTGYEYFLSYVNIHDSRILLDINNGLSLSDRYWVNDGKHSWDEINYFDNPFSDDLGILTLQPEGVPIPKVDNILGLLNPSSSLGGNLKKKWAIAEDGTRLLYKRVVGYPGFEVYGEEIATNLYKCVFEPEEYVPYKTEIEGNNLYAVCPNMLKKDEELIPIFDLIINKPHFENDYHSLINVLKEFNIPNSEEFICNMLACDFIIANKDRHYNNFGIIRNVETLEYTRMAPIYDSGNCLWNWRLDLEVDKSQEYYARPFGSPVGEDAIKLIKRLPSFGKLLDIDITPFYNKTEEILSNMHITPNRAEITLDSIKHQRQVLEEVALEKGIICNKISPKETKHTKNQEKTEKQEEIEELDNNIEIEDDDFLL